MVDSDEVELLRARVAQLEAQHRAAEVAPVHPERGRTSAWWAAASAGLIIAACCLAPLSVASVWANTQLSDSDQYVATVAPLVDDPAVQDALATAVTDAVFESLDVEAVATDALETVAELADVPPRVADVLPTLAVPLASGVEAFTRDQVDAFLSSPQFAELWARVNRVAHEQMVKLLEGNAGGAVSARDDEITLNLAPVIAAVEDQLTAQGFDLAADIPEADKTFVLAQSHAISNAQGFYRLLNTLGVWLPLVATVLFVTGVVLARERRRALLKGGLGVAGAMVILGVGLTLARIWYVETTPADILNRDAAAGVFDALVRFMRTSLRAVGVTGLLVALVAFLAGSSPAAEKTRATFSRSVGGARSGTGWDTGGLGDWTFAHRRALQVSIFVVGGLVVMFWPQPTAWVVAGVALGVVLGFALVEFLGTPPAVAVAIPGRAEDATPGRGPAHAAQGT